MYLGTCGGLQLCSLAVEVQLALKQRRASIFFGQIFGSWHVWYPLATGLVYEAQLAPRQSRASVFLLEANQLQAWFHDVVARRHGATGRAGGRGVGAAPTGALRAQLWLPQQAHAALLANRVAAGGDSWGLKALLYLPNTSFANCSKLYFCHLCGHNAYQLMVTRHHKPASCFLGRGKAVSESCLLSSSKLSRQFQ